MSQQLARLHKRTTMIYTYTLSTQQDAVMAAKVTAMTPKDGKNAPTVQSLIDQKVAEFIEACSRDVGMDLDAKLAKAIFAAPVADKQAVLEMLEAAPMDAQPAKVIA